jgi:hypothetical protein
MAYTAAAALATRSAKSDSENFRLHRKFLPKGTRIGENADNTHLYDFKEDGSKKWCPEWW